MSRSGIILAGIVVLDIVNIIDHWPEEETIALIERTEHGAGGPPHNAAAGLMKLGAPFPVTLLGAVGDDAYGDILLASGRAYGLDMSHMKTIPGAVTSHTHVMSSKVTGKRTFFVQAGVNDQLTVADLNPRDANAKFYYLGSPGVGKNLDSGDGWRTLLAAAREMGMKTCMELVPVAADVIHALVRPCLPLCDYLVVNDYEAESLTAMTLHQGERFDWTAAEAACRKLLDLGVTELACIHHPDGAVAVTVSGEVARAGSVNVDQSEIIGTTGAGDAFYAGLLYGLHENWPLGACLDLGNAAAATSLQSATTSATIRTQFESMAYARQRGLRRIGD